eukprot:CAMPEP_0202883860 /NCGR_PEP_ID=MMETSP1391-20130828/40086_1 /ASSEMBLY_ACC=CAM_ASM_000867 /TAXON_ID=1034604 /ORGANISM="Chlamydomonas leiostraca, Strain SAG 11-49" /LENGTH=165 /DNA_ID=CAMNT_0049566951 /DNA_START=8 /DNA_END=505 /DNA_ORIENTATION=-
MTAKSMASYRDVPLGGLPGLSQGPEWGGPGPEDEDRATMLLQQHEVLMAQQQATLMQAQQAVMQAQVAQQHAMLSQHPQAAIAAATAAQPGSMGLQQQSLLMQQLQQQLARSGQQAVGMSISPALLQQLMAAQQHGHAQQMALSMQTPQQQVGAPRAPTLDLTKA